MPPEDELFPASPRVVYGKAPLTQVVCQLRFPPILRIESEAPADFQDRIRHNFPMLERQRTELPDIPPEVMQAMGIAQQASSNFQFRTEDQKHIVSLGSDSLSLTSRRYGQWPSFRGLLLPAFQALNDIYKPSFYSRIGLRYINTIDRSKLGIESLNWRDLLRAEVLGELVFPEFAANAVDVKRVMRLTLPNVPGCGLYLQHGFVKRKATSEYVYRLDFDFYRDEKTEVSDAESVIDSLNAMVGRAFRWCITQSLHERLEPAAVELAAPG